MKDHFLAVMTLLVLGIVILVTLPSADYSYHDSLDKILKYVLLLFVGVMACHKDRWLTALFMWFLFCLFMCEVPVTNKRMFLLFLAIMFYQTLVIRLDDRNTKWILNGIIVIAVIHMIWILMQTQGIRFMYFVTPTFENAKLHPGVMTDTNTAGSLLALCVPAFLRKNKLYLLGLIPMAICLYITKALGAVGAFFIGWLIYSVFTIKSPHIKIFSILLSVFLFVGYMWKKEPARLRGDLGYRFDMLPLVITQVMEHPIKGYGLGAFYWLFQVQHKETYGSMASTGKKKGVTWRRCHNDWLEAAYNFGLVGLLLVIGFLYSHIDKFIRKRKYTVYGIIGLTGVVIAMVNATVHFLWHTPVILIAIVYLAILVNQTREVN